MAIVDGSLQLGYKNTAWFTANASLVLLVGQIVYLEQTGTYKIGNGVTQLSALSFLGVSSYTLTTSEIGAVINSATSATPNDTDLVMSVDTSIAKKNTWTQIKAFLKTYFDTVYATITDLTGYVKKGTLTTNTIQKATSSDTIGNSNITDDGTTVTVNSTTDGEISGNDNFSYKTTTGGYRVGYYVQSGATTIQQFYNNSVNGTVITEVTGLYAILSKNRFSIKNLNTNTTKFHVDMSTGYTAIGNDYFVPNERVEIRDGNLRINDLTASQIVETDASKNLVSAAKGTAYNKDFGTGTANIVEIGSTLSNSQIISTDANGKLQTLTTATYPSLTELAYIKGLTSSIQTQLDGKLSSTTYDLFITTGNQTTTSNVASNITDLVSPTLTANKRYRISGVIHFGCNNAGGVKYQITVPSGTTLWVMGRSNLTNANTVTWVPILSSGTLSTAFSGVNSTDYGALCIDGEISIGATAGVIQFGFASATNTQTSTVYKLGTQLTLTQIN